MSTSAPARSDGFNRSTQHRHPESIVAAAVASVGSKGDSYDNALAEAYNSLVKAELIRHQGAWRGIDDVEIAVAEYVDWFNNRRLHGEIGHVPPAEYEALHALTNPAELLTKTN